MLTAEEKAKMYKAKEEFVDGMNDMLCELGYVAHYYRFEEKPLDGEEVVVVTSKDCNMGIINVTGNSHVAIFNEVSRFVSEREEPIGLIDEERYPAYFDEILCELLKLQAKKMSQA